MHSLFSLLRFHFRLGIFIVVAAPLFAMPVHAAPQNAEDGKAVTGGTWENGETLTGTSGEYWTILNEASGAGGNGVALKSSTLVNRGSIEGGSGGDHLSDASLDSNVITGAGGHGVFLRNSGTNVSRVLNYGTIQGGISGGTIGGGTSGAGGDGVYISGDGNIVENYGSIIGGRVGNGNIHGPAGLGVRIVGNDNIVITGGHIQGNHPRPFAGWHVQQSNAIEVWGNGNILELRNGYSFGSNTNYYALVRSGTENTLSLGGRENAIFDQTTLNKYFGFDYAKTGSSSWDLHNTGTVTWNVFEGELNVSAGAKIGGANVYEGVLEFETDGVPQKFGNVEVFGAGTYVGPGGKTGRYSGGALPLGRGGTATSVTLHGGATAYAYSNDQYLAASDAITVEGGLKFYLKSNDWVDGQEYKILQGATATIDSAYQGNGKYYSLAGYDFRAFQSGANALHIQMLRLKNISENPDLTYNQESTAERVDSLPDGTPIKDIVEHVETGKIPDVLDQLSGEIYATLPTALRNHDTRLRNTMLSSISRNALANVLCKAPSNATKGDDPCQKKDDATGKLFTDPVCREKREAGSSCPSHDLWVSGGWNYSRESATNNVGMSEFTGPEVALGVDSLFDNSWGSGVFFRYSDKELELSSRRSEANVRSFNFGAYGTKLVDAGEGSLRFTLGGIYGYHDIKTERHVKFSSTIAEVDEEVQSGHTAHTLSAFTEIAWGLPVMEKLWFEPFANIAYTNTYTGSARETGGSMTALRVSSATQDNIDTRLGFRAAVPFADWGNVNAELGWQHTFGDNEPKVGIGFKNGGKSYPIKGSKIARDAATIGLGLSASLSESVTFDLTYDGVLGENSQSHTGQLMFSYWF